jgi:hypothetical protein
MLVPDFRQSDRNRWADRAALARHGACSSAISRALTARQGDQAAMSAVDREKVLSVLLKRFPGAPTCDIAAAANAIVGLELEYDEVPAGEVSRFDCEWNTRPLSIRHVTSGDVRMFYRVRR